MANQWNRPGSDAVWSLAGMEENVTRDEYIDSYGGGKSMIKDKVVKCKAPVIETADKCSTGLKQKRENFQSFIELIKNQFDHGGDKYATGTEGKEFTDLICEAFPGESGVDWVLGTCMKYMGRYKNFRREKDLLKVGTYMYLLWLKGGFHLKGSHDEDTAINGGG